MSSNLPPGVSENTYGAPWNDQVYVATYYFVSLINDTYHGEIVMRSDEQFEYEFSMQGPMIYSYSDLYNTALDEIENLIKDFLEKNYISVVILNIEQV